MAKTKDSRRILWFRLWHGISDSGSLAAVAKATDKPMATALAVWIVMCEHASMAEPRGSLRALKMAVVDAKLDLPAGTAGRIEAAMHNEKMINMGAFIRSWDEYQPKSDADNSTERTRRYRDKLRDRPVTGSRDAPEIEREKKDISPSPDIPSPRATPETDGRTNGGGKKEPFAMEARALAEEFSALVKKHWGVEPAATAEALEEQARSYLKRHVPFALVRGVMVTWLDFMAADRKGAPPRSMWVLQNAIAKEQERLEGGGGYRGGPSPASAEPPAPTQEWQYMLTNLTGAKFDRVARQLVEAVRAGDRNEVDRLIARGRLCLDGKDDGL